MQRKLIFLLLLACLALCLLHPAACAKSASYGLGLWYQALLPVLLPVLLLTTLLRQMEFTRTLDKILSPITTRILHLPPSYGSLVFFGLLSGLPAGAVLLQSLPEKDHCEKILYPLLLTTHVSPGFITGYLSAFVLERPSLSPLLFLTVYGGNLLAAWLFFRPKTYDARTMSAKNSSAPVRLGSFGTMFQNAVQTSLQTVLAVGVNVTLFCVAAGFCTLLLPPLFSWIGLSSARIPFITMLFSGLCEVTGGCGLLLSQNVPFRLRAVLVVFFASFGGLSGIFQTKSVLRVSFPLLKYIGIKISTALFSACAMLILLRLFF